MDVLAKRKLLLNLRSALDCRELQNLDRRRRAVEIADDDRRELALLRLQLDGLILDETHRKLLREIHKFNLSAPIKLWIPCRCHSARVVGQAVAYHSRGALCNGKYEFVYPQAFLDSLSNSGEMFIDIHHEKKLRFAYRSHGTMDFFNTAEELRFSALIPNDETGRRVIEEIRNEKIHGASISYRPKNSVSCGWSRCLYAGRLAGVALVEKPSYPTEGSIVLETPF